MTPTIARLRAFYLRVAPELEPLAVTILPIGSLVAPLAAGAVAHRRQRSERNASRTSLANSCGSSQAGKWPPLPTSLKYATPG